MSSEPPFSGGKVYKMIPVASYYKRYYQPYYKLYYTDLARRYDQSGDCEHDDSD